jgi:hypothetical protein
LTQILSLICLMCLSAFADSKPERTTAAPKVQEVNFSEMSLKGTVRNPEGAFLVQKRGINFLPLIEINQDMDSRIRNSTQYVK